MGQMQDQLQQAMQVIDQLQKEIDTKATEQKGQAQIRQMELDSNERLAQMKADMELAKIEEKAKAEVSLKLLEAKLDQLEQQAQFLHERKMQLEAPQPETKAQAPPQEKKVSESLNYKDAPPDVRRQIEQQAGLTPSQHGDLEVKKLQQEAKPKPAPKPAAKGPPPKR